LKKIITLLILLLILGCTSEQVKQLKSVEIKEYEGKKLSSITDFRENSIKGPQYIDADKYTLKIEGLVDNPMELKYSEVLANQHYSKVVTLYCVEGWDLSLKWTGILLKDLFEQAKIQESANTVIFYAEDGYSTAHPLEYLINNDILLAFKQNDVTLPSENGFPFQLVAEDKWGYKWAKWITKIEISDNKYYKGFWEQRGYNNDGSLDGSKFE